MTTMEWHATTLVSDSGEPVTRITWRPKDGRVLITARVARRLLREVVAEAGPHHKSSSWYVLDRRPECLIGCVLYRAGVTEDELAAMDASRPTRIAIARMPARVSMTQAARRVLDSAQTSQDEGCNWGFALDTAKAVRPYRRVAS